MVSAKDWKEFKQQLDAYESFVSEAEIAQYTMRLRQWGELEYQRSYMIPAPDLVPLRRGFQKTFEECLDWIVAGRPTLAKKIKVKSYERTNLEK